jgi:cell division protein FtsA
MALNASSSTVVPDSSILRIPFTEELCGVKAIGINVKNPSGEAVSQPLASASVSYSAGGDASQATPVAIETDNPDVEVKLINSALVSLRIDGYKVSNPIGFKGKEIEVQIYNAFAPLVHISAIERVCDELQLDLVTVAVEPFAVCRACLGDDVESDFSGVVIDVGGGTTDIAVVDDGGVEGTKMFSIGGRSFTHQIAERLGLSFEDAEKLKLLADNPNMKPEIRKKFDQAIARNLDVWQAGVELALEEFDQLETMPGQVLLCGGGASLPEIPETLATGDWFKDLPFSRRPIVSLIDPDEIAGIVNETDRELDHTFVTAMGLLRVGIDTLIGTANDTSLKAKLARLLRN